MPDIKFLDYKNIPAILAINSAVQFSWPDRIIKQDLTEKSNTEIIYIGAFASTRQAPLLGYAVLGREGKSGSLMALIVSLEYRRMRIGTQLLLAVGDCAAYLNFRRLKLRVRKSNYPAIELYKSMKFKRDSIELNYYSDGEDAIIMSAGVPFIK